MTLISEQTLFSKEISAIEYQDVLDFCQLSLEEDIDLDYKKDWPNDLARVVCAFANTQGGVVITGVEEKGKTRLPKIPPIGVIGSPNDLRQRALNISFDGIFPPVEPEVKVCSIPPTEDHHVVVVRVQPTRLMHATDRRTRVYVRSKDSNRGYSLASLQELRWLSEQREYSLRYKDQLLTRSEARSRGTAIGFEDADAEALWMAGPSLLVSILPEFPTYKQVVDLRVLFDAVNSVGEVRSQWPGVDRLIPWRFAQWRSVPGGVTQLSKGMAPLIQYVEFGQSGHSYFEFNLEPTPANTLNINIADPRNVIRAYVILSYIDISIRFAAQLYELTSYRWPVSITIRIDGSEDTLLLYNVGRTDYLHRRWLSQPCPDQTIHLLNRSMRADALSIELPAILEEISMQLVWAYGLPWNRDQVNEWLSTLTGE